MSLHPYKGTTYEARAVALKDTVAGHGDPLHLTCSHERGVDVELTKRGAAEAYKGDGVVKISDLIIERGTRIIAHNSPVAASNLCDKLDLID